MQAAIRKHALSFPHSTAQKRERHVALTYRLIQKDYPKIQRLSRAGCLLFCQSEYRSPALSMPCPGALDNLSHSRDTQRRKRETAFVWQPTLPTGWEPFGMRKPGMLTRNQFLQLLTGCTGLAMGTNGAMLYEWFKWPPLNNSIKRPPKLGTTFSQLQCSYLGVDYQQAFEHICSLGFNTIRLCAYWSEIERAPNTFDFRILDWLLSTAEKHS